MHNQTLYHYASELREETDPKRRERLHTLLIEAEERFGARRERLDRTDAMIAELGHRIRRQETLIVTLAGHGRDIAAAEQLRALWSETLGVLESYRATLGRMM